MYWGRARPVTQLVQKWHSIWPEWNKNLIDGTGSVCASPAFSPKWLLLWAEFCCQSCCSNLFFFKLSNRKKENDNIHLHDKDYIQKPFDITEREGIMTYTAAHQQGAIKMCLLAFQGEFMPSIFIYSSWFHFVCELLWRQTFSARQNILVFKSSTSQAAKGHILTLLLQLLNYKSYTLMNGSTRVKRN